MDWDPARIRALRTALRLPQEKFAYQLGAAPKTVRNWELGKHPPSFALQRALDRTWESASSEQKRPFFAPPQSEERAKAPTAADSEGGKPSTSIVDPPVSFEDRRPSRS